MPLPALLWPLLALGAVAVLGGSKPSSSGGRRPRPQDDDENSPPGSTDFDPRVILHDPGAAPPPGWTPDVGDPCPGLPKGVYGAMGEDGECKVFWSPQIEEDFRDIVADFYQELGEPESLCQGISEIQHEGTYLEEYVLRPELQDFLIESLKRLYGLNLSPWPPEPAPDTMTPSPSHYWVLASWTLGLWTTLNEICGYERVT